MKMGSDQREKCVQFSKEIMELEYGKRRAEDEMEIWKKKFKDSECGKQRVEDDMEVWKEEFTDSECVNQRAKDEIEIWKQEIEGLESERTRADVEINLLKIKCMELEIQAGEMLNHGAELEDCKAKCHGLWVELKEKEVVCIDLHH
ncbi:uncharacterized protein LOC113286388 [Papaver somniferum]|uniref:uncharacterized protein LOC113286388 n=1 Tax=Papaver somniferum TaxID=3469 RepID=UPI000E70364F|nr:uncharacterized protein LOC113286388 [Papaver somniferum]